MPTTQMPAIVIEDYLYNKFVAASEAGGVLNAATQVNPGGGTGIQFQGRICPPEANVFPSVSVQFDTFESEPFGTHRDNVVMHFDIVLAIKQPFQAGSADTAQNARIALRNYVNDGNGNGLDPLLRTDRQLGGLCSASWIESLQYGVFNAKDSAAGTIAAAFYRFAAKALVTW